MHKANSDMLDFVLMAGVHQGLVHDHDCWAEQLMHGLQFADPDTDWETHMLQLKAIGSPKGVAKLAKQKFTNSIQMFDGDPTDPECSHQYYISITSVLTCHCTESNRWLEFDWVVLPPTPTLPTHCLTHSAFVNGVDREWIMNTTCCLTASMSHWHQ
jgi:hypothetical protein